MKSFLNLLKNNYMYVIWFIINFVLAGLMLGANIYSFLIAFALYALSITIALCPLGEKILRMMEGVRRLETRKHKEYLIPLFDEVYEDAKKVYPNIPTMEICVQGEMTVNACAIGRHTVAVTQGAIDALEPEKLQSLMAHEIGHIVHGHTKATLLNVVGNGLFTVFVFLLQIGIFINELVSKLLSGGCAVSIMFICMRMALNVAVFLFQWAGIILIAINSRKNEFQADKFAYECGYGDELVESLYFLQEYGYNDKISFSERLQSSHPHINARIEKLETMIDSESE